MISRLFFMVALMIGAILPAKAQEVDSLEYFNPNEVLMVTEDVDETARLAACAMVAGQWQYDKPYIHADGATLLGKLGKPIAKSKLKKGLNKAYKKIKLNKRWQSLVLSEDGQWQMVVLGLSLKGRYTYDPEEELLTLRWNGVPMKSHTHRDGKKMYIALDTDKLLVILHAISGIGHSDTLNALAFLSENFRNVKVGFEMKKK